MKSLIKKLIYTFSTVFILPIILLYKLLSPFDSGDTLFSSFSQFMSLFPGKFGVYLRASFYHHCSKDISKYSVISFLTLLSQKNTEIKSGVYIGPQCNIGLCQINKNTLLGSGVHIMSGKQQHNTAELTIPIKDQGGIFEKIKIGEDCWIGNGSLIMANIGNQCIVGAGSIVIHDIPDFSIVAGNPAKIIKSRIKVSVCPTLQA